MRYQDIVYGSIEIPREVVQLFCTDLLLRLRGISQDSMPVEFVPCCTVPNRFQHGIGVWYLADLLTKRQDFSHLANELPIAGLLHDAGNVPFSHVGEQFLREATGHDGETHLRVALYRSELGVELIRRGFSLDRLCDLVTGKAKPWSDLLCGTIDIDNIDNIIRWARCQGIMGVEYDPYRILGEMRVSADGAIEFDASVESEVARWQAARVCVYQMVYSEPHFAFLCMLQRAMELAHVAGEINEEFWMLDDRGGLEYLAKKCSPSVSRIALMVQTMQPYDLVASWDGDLPPFYDQAKNWVVRKALADHVAETFKIEPWKVSAAVSKARDARKIAIPYRGQGGWRYDTNDHPPFWRIRLYVRDAPERVVRALSQCDLPALCDDAVRQ